MIHKIKLMAFFLVLFGVSSNIFAQKLKVYEDHIDLNKVYQQGTTVHLTENNDIRIYSSSNHQTENSVAVNKANPNNVIISTNGRIIYDSNGDLVTVHQPYFYSKDGGVTWNGSENNPNGIYSYGDPVVLFDISGNAYYITLGNPGGIYVLKSTDGGATWGSTVNADPLNGYDDDKEHAAADVSGTYPNNIYVAWTDFADDKYDVIFTRSTNGGTSFGNRITLFSGSKANQNFGQGTNIAIGPNGEVYVVFAWYNGNLPESGIRFTKSTNGGASFSQANVAFTIAGIRTSDGRISEFNNTRVNSFPSMEVDRSNGSRRGWIYIVYADKSTGDSDIYLRRSTDGGATWSGAIRVNSDQVGNGKQQWMPSIDVDEVNGKIYVSYYNMDSSGFLTARYVAISDDGGTTFNCGRISDVRFTPTELGAGYNDGYMGDYYETAVYNSKLYATWSDNREGNFQAYISLGVTAHQYLSDNSTEVGSIGHWENSQFANYSVPAHFEFSPGETHVLRSTYSMFSGEKYNEWDYDNNVKNFRNFDILPNTNEITAKLKPTYSGISVKNSNEGTSNSSGSIQFKDPWYRDYADPSYGNNIRNRGAEAIYHSKSSPFNITTSSAYQGVFLGQNPTFDVNLPIYTVKAESPQTISINGRNHNFYFQNWEASPSGSADFQDADALETPVVFNNADATVKAVMKGTQLSNNINAYKNSSQRKIVRTANGDLYMVYESLGKVWLEKSTDNGSTWSLKNGGQPLSGSNEAKNPAIDFYGNTLAVVYQEKSGNYFNIKLLTFDNWGNLLHNYTVYSSNQNYTVSANPSIAWGYNGKVLIVWKDTDIFNSWRLLYKYGSLSYYNLTWYTSTPGPVSNTNYYSTNPSIARYKNYSTSDCFHLAWEQGPSYEEIKYYKITPNSNNTLSFSDYTEVSQPTGYGICKAPVIVVKNDNNPMVVYKLYDPSYPSSAVYVVRREKYSYQWSTSVEMTSVSNRYITSASLGYADNGTYVTFFTDNLSNVWYKRSYWSSGPFQVSGLTAQAVQTSNWDDMGNMKAMSFNHVSAPYEFKLTPAAVPQKAANTITNSQQIEGIVNSKDVYFDYNFGNILLDSQPVNFVKLDTDLKDKKNKDTENDLMTEPFVIDKSSELLVNASYFVNDKEKASELLDKNGFVEYEMELVDAVNPDKVISKLAGVKFNKDNLPELTQKYYSFNTEGLDNMQVRIKLNIKTNIKTETYNAKVYSANSEESNKKSNYETVNIMPKEIVKEYALAQNYPNPFNPTTTISYAIPKSGKVTLKVYDVLGKEVAVLVNGFKSKGKYSVRFNGNNLSSGIYFYKITSGDFAATKKLILMK